MLDRFFRLSENNTSVRTEVLAGLTTFLTMAYIIVLQPQILSGRMAGHNTGMDFGAITTATCLAAALASAIMGLYGRYPIAQAPGMGENFFFVALVTTLLPAVPGLIAPGSKTTEWQIGLGIVFYSGVLFLLLSMLGVREKLMNAISPSMRNGIAVGIGLFIVLIGMKNADLLLANTTDGGWQLNTQFSSPDLIVFFVGFMVTAVLYARRVPGAIVLGIIAATGFALAMRYGLPLLSERYMNKLVVKNSMLMCNFEPAGGFFSMPRSIAPTLFKLDLVTPLSWKLAPFIIIFLFMVLFDTLGTLVGVAEQAGMIRDNRLPRARQAMMSDAIGTVAGAALGTSTVTSFIESAAGVEQGGRTGLTALVAAALFLAALLFSPIIEMIGSYPAITAPALIVVGAMMMRGVVKIDWNNYAESLPAFLIIAGIPLTYSIADGLALGFIVYPFLKLFAGQRHDVRWLNYIMAVVLVVYFIMVRLPGK